MEKNQNKSTHHYYNHLIFAIALFQAFTYTKSQSFIGVNYGTIADNLPPAASTVALLQSTTITKVRLYNADPTMIQALAGTGISIVIGVSNGDIPSLAGDLSIAGTWISTNVLPYVPSSNIAVISVGNELLNSGDPSLTPQLLPAMQNLRSALAAVPAAASIKISTVHSMAVLSQSDPPSAGAFHSDLAGTLTDVLGFLRENGSPFMINPYPYFAYRDDPRPETLSFCLFESNPGRLDSGSQLMYTNMFDAQLDAIRTALNRLSFNDIEIVIAETGWPYNGDANEVGASVENARAYNGNLVAHLRALAGTPLVPGKSVDTYIFALYNEDLKPGPTSERSFGLYGIDGSMNYDAGLSKSGSSSSLNSSTTQPSTSSPQTVSGPPPPFSLSQAPGGVCESTTQTATSLTSADGRTIQPGWNCYLPSAVGSLRNKHLEQRLLQLTAFIILLFR